MTDRHAWITPPAIPAEITCFRLEVPRDKLILAAVHGALDELGKWWNWQYVNAGDVHPGDMAERMRVMISNHLVSECFDMPNNWIVRLNGCNLEVSYNNGIDWEILGDVCGPQGPQGPQGEQGIQGPQGPQGDPGDCTGCVQPQYGDGEGPATANFDEENICAAATQLVDWLVAIQQSALDTAEAQLTDQLAISEFVITLLDNAIPEEELWDADVTGVIDAFYNMLIADINTRRAEVSSVTNQDEWKQDLYCQIKAASPQTLTEAEYQQWITDSVRITEATLFPKDQGRASDMWAKVVDYKHVKARWDIYSQDKQNDCRLLGWCVDNTPPPETDINLRYWLPAYGAYGPTANDPLNGDWDYPFSADDSQYYDPIPSIRTTNISTNVYNQSVHQWGWILDLGQTVRVKSLRFSFQRVDLTSESYLYAYMNAWTHLGENLSLPWANRIVTTMGSTLPATLRGTDWGADGIFARFVYVTFLLVYSGTTHLDPIEIFDVQMRITSPCDATFLWNTGDPCA